MLHVKVKHMTMRNYQKYLVLHLYLFNNPHHLHQLLEENQHQQMHKDVHHNLNNSDQFHYLHLLVRLVSFFSSFCSFQHLTFLGTRKSQQAQALRLKQEQFQKLALQAKQQGILNFSFDHLS